MLVLHIFISNRRKILGPDLVDAAGVSILNCSHPLWFWMSWENSFIRAGIGNEPGQFEMVYYNDSTPLDIVGVGVAVYDSSVNFSIYDSKRITHTSKSN